MKFKNPLIVVRDMEKSKDFYMRVLGLRITADLGANVTLTGGIALQTLESWTEFANLETAGVKFGGNNAELYFEDDNFDELLQKLEKIDDIIYLHKAYEHPWGQRAVRFYDPDENIIEIGESMKTVCMRFINSGMTAEQTAERMGVPLKMVRAYAKL